MPARKTEDNDSLDAQLHKICGPPVKRQTLSDQVADVISTGDHRKLPAKITDRPEITTKLGLNLGFLFLQRNV